MIFQEDKFNEWEQGQQIPQAIVDMVETIAEKVGCEIEWKIVNLVNRGGQTYGWAKGFSLTHCTSSMETGPGIDYSDAMRAWLVGLCFRVENSYGDNGMDSATNWHDTYWTHEFIYLPSKVFEEEFIKWEDNDYEEGSI